MLLWGTWKKMIGNGICMQHSSLLKQTLFLSKELNYTRSSQLIKCLVKK